MKRFFDKVLEAPSGCHLWTGSLDKDGYGRAYMTGRHLRAHRLAWELAHGEDPGRLLVLHRCDRPECVNPAHLFLGTHRENLADRDEKGRQAQGERVASAKLTREDVLEIRQRLASGETQAEIASDFPITRATISDIKRGKNWGWL